MTTKTAQTPGPWTSTDYMEKRCCGEYKPVGTGECWTCGKSFHAHHTVAYAKHKAEECRLNNDHVMAGQWENAATRAGFNMC